MLPVELEADSAVSQGRQLKNDLQEGTGQQAPDQTVYLIRSEQNDDDDSAVENGRSESRQRKPFQGKQNAGQDRGHAHKENSRCRQPHQVDGDGQQGGVLKFMCANEPGHLAGKQFDQKNQAGQHGRCQTKKSANNPPQFRPFFRVGEVAENRNKGRGNHLAAYNEIEQRSWYKAGDGVCAEQVGGTKQIGLDDFPRQTKHPAGDVADG